MKEQILVLNNFGFNVCMILNPITQEKNYYAYTSFTPVEAIGSTMRTFKHVIVGKDITRFLSERSTAIHLNTSQMEENTLRSHIAALSDVQIQYSSHYLWENYLAIRK